MSLPAQGNPQDEGLDKISDQSYNMVMKISASKFKEQCLALLDEVGADGIVITKHGRPVARLVPYESDSRRLLGCLKGRLRIRGDVMSTGVSWHAES